jgi:diguanylate cyclase (GGDEF)-like protein
MLRQFLNKVLSQPIFRIQILSFLIVAFLPIIFVSINIYRVAWENEWHEIREKHQLLAENMASPILDFVTYYRNALSTLAENVPDVPDNPDALFKLTNNTLKWYDDFQCISIIDNNKKTIVLAYDNASGNQAAERNIINRNNAIYKKTLETGKAQISGITPGSVNSIPVIIFTQPIHDKKNKVTGVIMAEVKTDEIVQVQKNIHFGKRGHSAIVDQYGHVIAHPNPEWMRTMHDLSKLTIVKAMLAGKTGVMEFYSPYVKENMVAGYASIPSLGWGIMVPQPKSEVERQVNRIMESNYYWIIAGAALAITLAMLLIRWITRPINVLSNSAKRLAVNSFEGSLPEVSSHVPREIKILTDSLNELVNGLQSSRKEINSLNASLQSRIDEATNDLKNANTQLQRLADSDHLTELSNRRYFESTLASSISGGDFDDLNILLIDIDYFKSINDKCGHAAGDAVLIQLSELLGGSMRENDLLARYGGDEIVVKLKCSAKVARERAETLRKRVEEHEFICNGKNFHVTISVGLLCSADGSADIDELMNMADAALYKAKQSGRNMVVEYSSEN